jgi:hypothetical protein
LNNLFNSDVQTITTQGPAFLSSTQYTKYDGALLLSIGYRLNESPRKGKAVTTDYGEKDF